MIHIVIPADMKKPLKEVYQSTDWFSYPAFGVYGAVTTQGDTVMTTADGLPFVDQHAGPPEPATFPASSVRVIPLEQWQPIERDEDQPHPDVPFDLYYKHVGRFVAWLLGMQELELGPEKIDACQFCTYAQNKEAIEAGLVPHPLGEPRTAWKKQIPVPEYAEFIANGLRATGWCY